MTVEYVSKATGTITAISEFDKATVKEGDVVIPIIVSNTAQETVFTAEITFYVSMKKASNKVTAAQ